MFSMISAPSAIANIVQTLGLLAAGWVVNHSYMTGDQATAGLAALGTLITLGYNVLNHNSALQAPPPEQPQAKSGE